MLHTKQFSEEEIEKRTSRLEEARYKRSLETEKNDKIVLECLRRYQRLTIKQIEKILKKGDQKQIAKRSFLLNSLKRLEDEHLIFSKTSEDTVYGKLKKYYFYKFTNQVGAIEIIIPKNAEVAFLDKTPTAYSISNDKIAISSADNQDFINRAKFSKSLETKQITEEEIVFRLPKSFIDFYSLQPNTFYFEKEITKNSIILKKIKIVKSADEEKDEISNTKKILILEDHKEFGKTLAKRLERDGHNVVLVQNVEEFFKMLKNEGKTFDVISLDRKVGFDNVAKRLSYEIRYNAPQAKVGLLTATTLSEQEEEDYQNLDFDYILPKKSSTSTGFNEVGDELAAWLESF